MIWNWVHWKISYLICLYVYLFSIMIQFPFQFLERKLPIHVHSFFENLNCNLRTETIIFSLFRKNTISTKFIKFNFANLRIVHISSITFLILASFLQTKIQTTKYSFYQIQKFHRKFSSLFHNFSAAIISRTSPMFHCCFTKWKFILG